MSGIAGTAAIPSRAGQSRIWPATVPAILVVSVVLLPFAWLAVLSFFANGRLSFDNYNRMLVNPSYGTIVLVTFELSALVTLLTILLGYPTAYFLSRQSRIVATLALGCIAIPFWTSLLVRTYAWMVLLQRNGLINGWLMDLGLISRPLRLANSFTGTTIGMVHIMLPFFVFPLYSAMKQVDPDLVRAARSLGASNSRAFWQIFLPMSAPGFFVGALLTFILCLGFYVTPQLLGGGNVTTVSMKIQDNITMYGDWGASSALAVVLLVAVVAALLSLNYVGLRYIRR